MSEQKQTYRGAARRALPALLEQEPEIRDNYALLYDGELGFAYSVEPEKRADFARRLRALADTIEREG